MTANLDKTQLLNYFDLAKHNKIYAIITISNEYTALPSHHGILLNNSERKDVMNCHWSWYSLVTHALLVENYKNDAKRYIRDEFCRYISHDSDGVRKISKMNFEWSDLVQGELSITPGIKKSEAVLKTVTTWHQESRNICLIMRRDLSVFVPLKMPHSHQTDPVLRLKVYVDKLVTEFELTCTLGKPEIVPWG